MKDVKITGEHTAEELAEELARVDELLGRIEHAIGGMPGLGGIVKHAQLRTPAARLEAVAVNVERMQSVATDAFNGLESAQAELRQIKGELAATGRLLRRVFGEVMTI